MTADRRTEGGSAGETPREAAVPTELLRAGVYVPEPRRWLEEAVSRSSDGSDPADELLATLASDPALLDEAVRRMASGLAARGVDSLLPLRPGDVLLAAPLARECGIPVRGLDAGPSDAAFAAAIHGGERILVVTAVHDREAWRRTRAAVGRAGGTTAGCVCLSVPRGDEAPEEVWSPLESTRPAGDGIRSTDHANR